MIYQARNLPQDKDIEKVQFRLEQISLLTYNRLGELIYENKGANDIVQQCNLGNGVILVQILQKLVLEQEL
ncbi:unnamed protein product [Paramecium primaurelia]|uniref:Uncharacterized protein n=1 Tax=Paramecium primaurelia TaxID=5886 RepID=A0A8S1Q5Y8_PARPR|nr:unnamed protein product [Paramecium primaurelia]